MDDQEVLDRIRKLVDEEHQLYRSSTEGEGLGEDQHQRLNAVEVALDQCWDLLRQRRSRRAAGENPDEAAVRDESTVEGYRQ